VVVDGDLDSHGWELGEAINRKRSIERRSGHDAERRLHEATVPGVGSRRPRRSSPRV